MQIYDVINSESFFARSFSWGLPIIHSKSIIHYNTEMAHCSVLFRNLTVYIHICHVTCSSCHTVKETLYLKVSDARIEGIQKMFAWALLKHAFLITLFMLLWLEKTDQASTVLQLIWFKYVLLEEYSFLTTLELWHNRRKIMQGPHTPGYRVGSLTSVRLID